MKICGCNNCRQRGEKNHQEDFELYCSTRELEANAVFENIFKASYSFEEMTELYDKYEPQFNGKSVVVKNIDHYSMYDDGGGPFGVTFF